MVFHDAINILKCTVCHLIRIAQEIFVGMGIGTVKRITVMVDVGTDVIIITIIITIIIIETHHQITHSQASGETAVEAALLEVEERDDIPQVTRIVEAEVRVVAEVQVDILLALPALPAAATLTMIVALPVEEVIPAVVAHQVVGVAPAVVAERVDTKKIEDEQVSGLSETCLFCFRRLLICFRLLLNSNFS